MCQSHFREKWTGVQGSGVSPAVCRASEKAGWEQKPHNTTSWNRVATSNPTLSTTVRQTQKRIMSLVQWRCVRPLFKIASFLATGPP